MPGEETASDFYLPELIEEIAVEDGEAGRVMRGFGGRQGVPSFNKKASGFGRIRGLRPNRPRAVRVSELSSIVTRTAVFQQKGLGRFGNSRDVMRQRREQRWYGAPEIETGDAGTARNDWSLSSGVRHHRRLKPPTLPRGFRRRSASSEASPQGSNYSPNQLMR